MDLFGPNDPFFFFFFWRNRRHPHCNSILLCDCFCFCVVVCGCWSGWHQAATSQAPSWTFCLARKIWMLSKAKSTNTKISLLLTHIHRCREQCMWCLWINFKWLGSVEVWICWGVWEAHLCSRLLQQSSSPLQVQARYCWSLVVGKFLEESQSLFTSSDLLLKLSVVFNWKIQWEFVTTYVVWHQSWELSFLKKNHIWWQHLMVSIRAEWKNNKISFCSTIRNLHYSALFCSRVWNRAMYFSKLWL